MNDYLRLLSALTAGNLEFVVVGGTAAVLHGATTATYDLDVLMPFDRTNCERLLQVVAPLNPRHSHRPDRLPVTQTAEELTGYRNLYLLTDLGRLDVLGALPPLDDVSAIFRRSISLDVAGTSIRVLALDDLITVKAAMGRPKDKQTELELRAIAATRAGG